MTARVSDRATIKLKRGSRRFAVGRGGRHLGVHTFSKTVTARTVYDAHFNRYIAYVEEGPDVGLYVISQGEQP